jgi:hypothetical protein
MTLEFEVVAIDTTSSKATDDPGAATNSCTMPPRDQEAMTKATRNHVTEDD